MTPTTIGLGGRQARSGSERQSTHRGQPNSDGVDLRIRRSTEEARQPDLPVSTGQRDDSGHARLDQNGGGTMDTQRWVQRVSAYGPRPFVRRERAGARRACSESANRNALR